MNILIKKVPLFEKTNQKKKGVKNVDMYDLLSSADLMRIYGNTLESENNTWTVAVKDWELRNIIHVMHDDISDLFRHIALLEKIIGENGIKVRG